MAMGRLAETIEQSARALRDSAELAASRSTETVEAMLGKLEQATEGLQPVETQVVGLIGQLARDSESSAKLQTAAEAASSRSGEAIGGLLRGSPEEVQPGRRARQRETIGQLVARIADEIGMSTETLQAAAGSAAVRSTASVNEL